MLKKIVSPNLKGFNKIKSEMAGKTGTTNDYVDGWFMGITPSVVVGTWVGGDERWVRFRDIGYGTGSKLARPIFAKFLERIENDPKANYDVNKRFAIPPGDIGIELDCELYKQNNQPTDEETDGYWSDDFADELEEEEGEESDDEEFGEF